MQIDFYYWGNMCPISTEIINLLKHYMDIFTVNFYDITGDRQLAKEQNMFFPFLTVVDRVNRFYSPISEAFLDDLIAGQTPAEQPYRPALGKVKKSASIVEITANNYSLASDCTGRKNCAGCQSKISMYQQITSSTIGYMNVEDGTLLGGAEFYPSLYVPYNIPRGSDIAFITCVYLSDEQYDYKSMPLRALERHLSKYYKKIVVISDEIGVFPNGDLDFFVRNGYKSEKVLFEDDYCKLHLMSKLLNE